VASSDWWASRKVVSVTASAACPRSSAANRSGPAPEAVPGARRRGDGEVDGGQLADRVDQVRALTVRLVHVTSAR
jgi:hypothetical protein